MTNQGPPCDLCSGHRDVQRWTIRPGSKPPRTRWLCRTCARCVQIAYDAAKPARGADIITERLPKRDQP